MTLYNYFCLVCGKTWVADKTATKCICKGKLKLMGKASSTLLKGTQEKGNQTKRNRL